MYKVDDMPETIHLYVVREGPTRPSFAPIVLSLVTLSLLIVLSIVTPSTQSVTRVSLHVPAVPLGVKTFTVSAPVIPTGIKTYPATTSHGILTITNGSVISQTIPQGFKLANVITDRAVFVPAGNANGYGYAVVSARAGIAGASGNIPVLAVDTVIGSSVYIRNLTAFHGGRDAYSVKFVTAQDKQTALTNTRQHLAVMSTGLHYPCQEFLRMFAKIIVTWRCQFVSYQLPKQYHIIAAQLVGKNLLVDVWFVAHSAPMWVK